MDVYKLVDKLGGEIVRGNARVVIDGARVVIGTLKEKGLELTEEGIKLAEKHDTKVSAKAKPMSKKRARNEDGTLKADDPSTPDVNEAWANGDD